MEIKAYNILPRKQHSPWRGGWDLDPWRKARHVELSYFRPEGSSHRPLTQVKLLYDAKGLWGVFRVRDRYVRCVRTRFQDPVYKDSCVEFFVQPKPDAGYFNFEFNCGGALLASYIEDPTRVPGGFKAFTPLSREEGGQVRIYHSLPEVVDPEIREETLWLIEFFIPFALFEQYVGTLETAPGAAWRANFYKCADESSHPHWGAWAPVDELNFHRPPAFGALRFV